MRSVWPLVLVSLALGVVASPGDRDHHFNYCVDRLAVEHCEPGNVEASTWDRKDLDWSLRWARWSCLDNCKYRE
jgi:hypothetical protein